MKEAIYHVKVDKSGIVFEVTGTREGYDKKLQNRKLFSRFFTVEAAKIELSALKAEGYSVTRGESL